MAKGDGAAGGRLTTAVAAATAVVLVAVGMLFPSVAPARFATGVAGPEFLSTNSSVRDQWWDRAIEARNDIVRVNVYWRRVAPKKPANPRNPADPGYDFSGLDAAAREAAAREATLLVTVFQAPAWAEGEDRAGNADAGTWRPDPGAFGDFGRALAARYSGSFLGLPRVRYFQAWNEPNLSYYLTPQWQAREPVAIDHYSRMLNSFYDGVKSVHADNVIVTAGTAPFGDSPGGTRIRPLDFWRKVMCVTRKRGKEVPKQCSREPQFDILAHHPINLSGGPNRRARHPDDASTPDFDKVKKILRAAEKGGNLTAGRHDLWATEVWWETDPPDRTYGVPLRRHANWLQEALYVLWRDGADAVMNLLIKDGEFHAGDPQATIEAGLYFDDGRPKPALKAWRFPFIVKEKKGKALAWGRAPADGKLILERKKGGKWERAGGRNVKAGDVFTERVRAQKRDRFRAHVGAQRSLTWRVR
jgi:hypothetical protein